MIKPKFKKNTKINYELRSMEFKVQISVETKILSNFFSSVLTLSGQSYLIHVLLVKVYK